MLVGYGGRERRRRPGSRQTVECISGPPCPDAKPRLVGEGAGLPDLPMELDLTTVELRFKASGYRPKL